MKKILILANHRKDRSPGQRFRFEQYLDYLNEQGFACELSPLLSEEDDRIFYSKGNWVGKFFVFLRCLKKRRTDLKRSKEFDAVFIFREAFFTGSIFFEKKFKKKGLKLLFDFDDSIWLPNVSKANRRLEWLKNYDKTKKLISLADVVIAGNEYLASYARKNNSNVVIIPTTIDTEEYQRIAKAESKICIGWSGSITTIQHFEYALPFLKQIKATYGKEVQIKVIGDKNYTNAELEIQGIGWSKEDEIRELSSFDIGIMPLPNDEWSNGKCGLKGLQYMALEIPTIMSPVGVNSEIIKDGVNGYLAESPEDWVNKLTKLIASKSLREQIGLAGRRTVEDGYSVHATKTKYLDIFKDLL